MKSFLFRRIVGIQPIIHKLRRSLTILLASVAILYSSTHIHTSPAHASSTAAPIQTTSLLSKLNPFQSRSASQLIDRYVRERLFADDVYDPVESAYREAFTDYPSSVGQRGAYPTVLAETAASALGKKDGTSLITNHRGTSLDNSASSSAGGITTTLMKLSDILQYKLNVSSSVSYYIIAAGLLTGCTVVPGILGMSYQVFQRMGIDRSEMKMYGKITDIAANAKKVTEEDVKGDDDEEEDEEDEEEDDE